MQTKNELYYENQSNCYLIQKTWVPIMINWLFQLISSCCLRLFMFQIDYIDRKFFYKRLD